MSHTHALIWIAFTFPKEPHYLWSAFKRMKHDSNPTILAYMRDCLDSCDHAVSSGGGGIGRIYVPLPVRSSYHTLRSFTTWNDPATPFGDRFMCPSGLKGEVATQNSFWVTIQAERSGCKHSQDFMMVVVVRAVTDESELLFQVGLGSAEATGAARREFGPVSRYPFMTTTFSTLSVQDLNDPHRQPPDALTTTLNALLKGLRLPFVLESPLDLTPWMLLAVLECITESRLPLPKGVRESRSDLDKVEAMKIFLGVLETDIIKMDVGLSDVDPRALARGEECETVFVGELLCWLGRKSGILPLGTGEAITAPPAEEVAEVAAVAEDDEDEAEDVFGKARDNTISPTTSHHRIRATTPSTRSSLTDSAHTTLSMVDASHPETDTSVMTMSFDDNRTITPPATPRVSTQQLSPRSTHPSVRVLHPTEIPEPHLGEDSVSYCDCSIKQGVPIQHTGWLQTVDHEEEVRTFLASHSANTVHRMVYTPKVASYTGLSHSSGGPSRLITRHTSPSQHRLALLNEKARLLTELANLNISTRR